MKNNLKVNYKNIKLKSIILSVKKLVKFQSKIELLNENVSVAALDLYKICFQTSIINQIYINKMQKPII